jgi:hypothetical protein
MSGEPARRPSFKDIVRLLDDVLIDAVIDDVGGASFWRQHFARTELRTSVPWPEFCRTLLAAVEDDAMTLDVLARGVTDAAAEAAAAAELAFFEPLLATRETATAKANNVLVVTMARFCTNIKWFGPFYERGQRTRIIAMVQELQSKPWFHGDISKEDADSRLSCRMEGTFLVRLSATTPGCPYTISMINNQHRRILYEGPGCVRRQ